MFIISVQKKKKNHQKHEATEFLRLFHIIDFDGISRNKINNNIKIMKLHPNLTLMSDGASTFPKEAQHYHTPKNFHNLFPHRNNFLRIFQYILTTSRIIIGIKSNQIPK